MDELNTSAYAPASLSYVIGVNLLNTMLCEVLT